MKSRRFIKKRNRRFRKALADGFNGAHINRTTRNIDKLIDYVVIESKTGRTFNMRTR